MNKDLQLRIISSFRDGTSGGLLGLLSPIRMIELGMNTHMQKRADAVNKMRADRIAKEFERSREQGKHE